MNHPTVGHPALAAGANAERLRAAIATEPTAPVVVGIQGVGGHGKTTLLGQLAETYRAAGVRVTADAGSDDAVDKAVLIDDAHECSDSVLRDLRALAEFRGARLIVAYRPWPRPEALSELISVLGRTSPPVLLGSLGEEELAERVERRLAVTPSEDWLDWLLEQTGGVPRYVERVLTALGPADVGRRQFPQIVLEQFHHDLDRLGATARDCVTAMAVGATPHPDVLASLLVREPDEVVAAMSQIRASGLVDSEDGLPPVARRAVLMLTPSERRLELVRCLIETRLARNGRVLPLVRPLVDAEVALAPESTLATAFEKGADEALQEQSGLASKLFAAAVSAGAPPATVLARRARAAAVSGDLDEALRLADQAIVDESVPDRQLGVQVAASVLAHRGLLERSAELCQWSVWNLRWPGDSAYAAVGLIGTGRMDEAEEIMNVPREAGPPTAMSGVAGQLADGIRTSVVGTSADSMSTLVRAASLSEPLAGEMLVPDAPASLAAVVALQCGESDVAKSMLDKSVAAGAGGPLLRTRHRLLAAWLPLMRGDTSAAREQLVEAVGDHSELQVRDRMLATAIESGIADRENDTTALTAVRGHARQAVAEHPVDLFALLPLGELVVGAARLRDQEWLRPHVDAAFALLANLGDPPLWSSLLRWKCLQAAVVLDDLDGVRQRTAELERMAWHNPLSAATASAAAVWQRILAGEVEQAETEQAARALDAAGLAWDGARLAGQAALRTSDRRAMMALLECARALQGKPPRPRSIAGGAGRPDSAGLSEVLSEREKEVAELVLSGLTYKQVGKRLFISAKTVEHHIGRIKQRLGSTTREELLTRLREILGRD
ncbi:helix-turn-helix transcriptional regulator [Parasphingorhabdus pacifica]